MKVLAALSGGVDSAVAAARAVEAGHEVTAVHLALNRNPQSHRTGARGCCTVEDSNDAFRAADMLGAPFYVWDMSEEFQEKVIADFINEYSQGRTPNPCLRCNESIKFEAVLDRAMALGFDAVCTGHYAQIVRGPNGAELHRAVDPAKDQSYVLGVLTADQIAHSMFPLGDSTKTQVREEAERRGILVAQKPDSHDICFIPDGDTAGWLSRQIETVPGDVIDAETGQKVGTHAGAQAFTVGQRRGLALGNPTGDGARRYVVDVDVKNNTVVVGPPMLLDINVIETIKPRWAGPLPENNQRVFVQVRAHGDALPAKVELTDDGFRVILDDYLRGVAAGQSAVIYEGTRVIGSATISRSRRVELA
ncbi:MAG: tRNA 2-thiouridine(34) synthase MnmA [Actinomycetales bacterium]|nr:tRNA 2-thiouridine(34) synthase MnmA [Actinomycetales bacterium]